MFIRTVTGEGELIGVEVACLTGVKGAQINGALSKLPVELAGL